MNSSSHNANLSRWRQGSWNGHRPPRVAENFGDCEDSCRSIKLQSYSVISFMLSVISFGSQGRETC